MFTNKLVQTITRLAAFSQMERALICTEIEQAPSASPVELFEETEARVHTHTHILCEFEPNEWWKTNEEQKEREAAAFCLAYAVVLIEMDGSTMNGHDVVSGFVMHAIALICIYQIKSILLPIDNE